MTQLLLQLSPAATVGPCALCGQPTDLPAGLQVVVAEGRQPVCRACGKRHAAPLAALVQLADEAARVGRIGRHTIFPPYTALLDLARAADQFAAVAPCADAGG
jgi:hypothetical protein